MFFMTRDCDECITHSKDWIELSTIVFRNFKIGRTDCHFERDVCDMFRVPRFPTVLFFKDNMIFSYNGEVDLQSLLNFLSGNNYVEAEVFRKDL
mmetsp:Transcript_29685/g.22039  ORF Transcript_29685/g.22039 Transcript_29685/m.22039 type:complete len:94 (-) Transcript_29685:368-649(-)